MVLTIKSPVLVCNLSFRYGLTPVHYAAMRGNNEALEQLAKYPTLDIEGVVDTDNDNGVSPLHMAVTYGHSESAR